MKWYTEGSESVENYKGKTLTFDKFDDGRWMITIGVFENRVIGYSKDEVRKMAIEKIDESLSQRTA